MGNKVTPIALRLGIYQKSQAEWFVERKQIADTLNKDMQMRFFIEKKFKMSAGISKITINRTRNVVEVFVKCLKPSVLVGKKGGEINALAKSLSEMANSEVRIKIFDIKKAEINALCIARDIVMELKKRGVSCKRILKRAVQNAKKNGAIGIRIECSGRLSGVEIARTEWYQEGAVPRQKLRANIDYASETSYAAWGTSGVKVWVYKGDKINRHKKLAGDKDVKS